MASIFKFLKNTKPKPDDSLTKDIMVRYLFSLNTWVDMTNVSPHAGTEAFINYVNNNKLTVINEEFFPHREKFWYNVYADENSPLDFLDNANVRGLIQFWISKAMELIPGITAEDYANSLIGDLKKEIRELSK